MSSPQMSVVEIVKDPTQEQVVQMAQVLADAVYDLPWNLKDWEQGSPDDLPSTSGSVVSYLKFFLQKKADVCTLSVNGIVVGFGMGVVFDDEIIKGVGLTAGIPEDDLKRTLAIDEGYTTAVGDYYLIAAAIQGDRGVGGSRRLCYRHTRVGNKSAYRWLTEMRLASALQQNSHRIWVRTHPEQSTVVGLHETMNFKVIGKKPVLQSVGSSSAPRTVMVAKREWLSNISPQTRVCEEIIKD